MERREFIRISTYTAGAWLLSDILAMPLSAKGTAGVSPFSPDPLLKMLDTGQVIIYIMKQEMGQNVITSLPLIIAEELEVSPGMITVERLPFKVSEAKGYTTWGSESIKANWTKLRTVGATAKMMLVTAAANRWNIPVENCKAQDGTVINTISNEIINYKELISEASRLIPPENPRLKNITDYKLVGKKMAKTNVSAIVTGNYNYTMDIKLPGMLYAALVRSPVYNGKVESWDDSALAGLKNVVKIIPVTQMPGALNRNAIAIVATNTWAALEGKRLLKVKWTYHTGLAQNSNALTQQFKAQLQTAQPAEVYGKNPVTPFKDIEHKDVYEASYNLPYLAHAAMEPVNCTAWYRDGRFEIWGGFQAPMYIHDVLPRIFDIERPGLSLNLMPMGGSFGRKEKIDNIADTMQLTKTLGVPVQMVFSRTDDMQADFYRPASHHRLVAIASTGGISHWRHQMAISTFPKLELSGPWDSFGGITNDMSYPVDDFQGAIYPVESPIPIGAWRSIGYSHNTFVIESFVDELATRLRIDPVMFRFNLFAGSTNKNTTRLKNVLKLCADTIGWHSKPAHAHFRGIACCAYTTAQAFAAHAIEISVTKDKLIKIHRCVAVLDCGLVIDPDGLKAQIESSLVWALSAILKNEITITAGIVDQQSYSDYPVLRMNEIPPFEIVLVDSDESPGGGGEPGVPSVGPALCNAIYAATGVRIRDLPIKKHGFRLV